MLHQEVFIGELDPVYGLSASPVAVGEVPALRHEAGDDAVEAGALVVQRPTRRLADPVLPRDQRAEVLGRPWDLIGEELEDHPADGAVANGQVQIHLRVGASGVPLAVHVNNRVYDSLEDSIKLLFFCAIFVWLKPSSNATAEEREGGESAQLAAASRARSTEHGALSTEHH